MTCLDAGEDDVFLQQIADQATCTEYPQKLNHAGQIAITSGGWSSQGEFGLGFAPTFRTGNSDLLQLSYSISKEGDASTTGTLSLRYASELRQDREATLAGFFGLDWTRSNPNNGSDDILQTRSLQLGLVGVRQWENGFVIDGYGSLGMGQSKLRFTDEALVMTADYNTNMVEFGASLSGEFVHGAWRIQPSFAASAGQTWIGDVKIDGEEGSGTGSASIQAGQVRWGEIGIAPEFYRTFDDEGATLMVSPEFFCGSESVSSSFECGAALRLGYEAEVLNGNGSWRVDCRHSEQGSRRQQTLSISFDSVF